MEVVEFAGSRAGLGVASLNLNLHKLYPVSVLRTAGRYSTEPHMQSSMSTTLNLQFLDKKQEYSLDTTDLHKKRIS